MADPGLPNRVIMQFACRVMRLDVDPNSPDDVYATLEANGAMRSRNGGEKLGGLHRRPDPVLRTAQISQPHRQPDRDQGRMLDGHALDVQRRRTGTVFLANRMGLFRSNDKGQSWQDMEIGRFSPLT